MQQSYPLVVNSVAAPAQWPGGQGVLVAQATSFASATVTLTGVPAGRSYLRVNDHDADGQWCERALHFAAGKDSGGDLGRLADSAERQRADHPDKSQLGMNAAMAILYRYALIAVLVAVDAASFFIACTLSLGWVA